MVRFLVQPEWYDSEDIWDRPFIYETNARYAAERYVDLNFANLDYPKEVECTVLNCDTKEWSAWIVHVESVPSFYAVKK